MNRRGACNRSSPEPFASSTQQEFFGRGCSTSPDYVTVVTSMCGEARLASRPKCDLHHTALILFLKRFTHSMHVDRFPCIWKWSLLSPASVMASFF
jgi:hypothetical protein